MASRLLPLCVAVLAATVVLPASARADLGDEIVVMRDGGLTRGELARAGVSAERELPLAGVEVVSAGDERGAALAALRADPDVVWAEPNRPRRLAAEPFAGALWGLHNTGQSVWWRRGTPDADIDAPQAWALTRGAGIVVAVADTGVDVGPSGPRRPSRTRLRLRRRRRRPAGRARARDARGRHDRGGRERRSA